MTEARSVPDLCQCGHDKSQHMTDGALLGGPACGDCEMQDDVMDWDHAFVPASPALPEPPCPSCDGQGAPHDGEPCITCGDLSSTPAPALPARVVLAWRRYLEYEAFHWQSVADGSGGAPDELRLRRKAEVEDAIRADERRVAEERIAELESALQRVASSTEWPVHGADMLVGQLHSIALKALLPLIRVCSRCGKPVARLSNSLPCRGCGDFGERWIVPDTTND